MAKVCVLQNHQVTVQTSMQSHDVCSVLEIPSWFSFVLQRSDPATKKISAHHLNGEAGSSETMDSGDSDCELLVMSIKTAPILAVDYLRLSGQAEWRKFIFLNPAPIYPPLIPLPV